MCKAEILTEKVCGKADCHLFGRPQPISNFAKRLSSKDGYNKVCRSCIRKRTAIINHSRVTKGTKVCINCDLERDVSVFGSCKKAKDGLNSWCKECVNIRDRAKRGNPRKARRKAGPGFNPNDHTRVCSTCNQNLPLTDFYKRKDGDLGYGNTCKPCRQDTAGKSNKTKTFYGKEKTCTKCGKTKGLEGFHKRKGGLYGADSTCLVCNRLKVKKMRDSEEFKEKERERYHNDLEYRLLYVTRRRNNIALKNNQKSGKTLDVLGIDIPSYKKYLEEQFYIHHNTGEPMTWDNYGSGWHVDHIISLDSFNMKNEEEQKIAFHYTNMQPLWAGANTSKAARTPEEWAEIGEPYMWTKERFGNTKPDNWDEILEERRLKLEYGQEFPR